MTVEVKICGVRTPASLDAAIAAGADFVGLVFFAKSPRNLSPADAARLATAARGRVKTVAVLVDPDDALIDTIAADVRPDVLQLHGSETPERAAAIKATTGLTVFKAVPVAERADVNAAARYEGIADRILFDAKAPAGADLPGGNGLRFDWAILEGASAPFALSGGLAASNVAEAIRLSGASLVDVSSGVETAPGEKDPGLIAQFVQAARGTAPEHKKAS
ncbi:phosphoribosylanthranilate isomerase [Methyloceanibacter sp. wino2]|uniref:phosphoribosylanthranilate isomerase n=1 Tax=Methyloceanibacter sp. wino2 TaxID=2170729 RepID=UPI000D3EE04B|nr:phosphoribosylanthranilate isomerase [Methyloceanibacter sp. wino2]